MQSQRLLFDQSPNQAKASCSTSTRLESAIAFLGLLCAMAVGTAWAAPVTLKKRHGDVFSGR
jgi:hypothetical protein